MSPDGASLRSVAITIDSSQVLYVGDGVTTVFNTVFPFIQNPDVLVEKKLAAGSSYSTLTIGVDYTLTGADIIDATTGARSPGSVTMSAAPLAGDSLRITRNTSIVQPTHFRTQGPFLPSTHEESLDRATMWGEDLERRLAVLEAGGSGSSYTATQVTDDFTVLTPAETTWPRLVACAFSPVTCVIGRVQNLNDGSEVLYSLGDLAWHPSGSNVSVDNVQGLTPGQTYRITYEVRS